MAKSRTSAPLNPPSGSIRIPARTPGTIGFYDQADPNVTTLLGDTPGTLGYGDHADPNLPKATLNAIAVRLPDGTAVSLGSDGKALDPDDGPFVYADYAAIKESVGDGFCVPLVQQKSKVMNTGTWKAGEKLSDKPVLTAGTIIATFSGAGVYESKARGNHAAFFVRYDTREGGDGIIIYDQYREWPDKETKAIEELKKSKQKLEELNPDSMPPGAAKEKAKQELDDILRTLAKAETDLLSVYPETDKKGRRFKRKNPGERFIRFDRAGSPSNNASAYSVVVH